MCIRDSPFTCERLSFEFVIENSSLDQDFIAVASQFSGGADGDGALIVWDEEDNSTFDSTIRGRCWEGLEGIVTDLGGGCGVGGEAIASGVSIGNADFVHRLRQAPNLQACALLLSIGRIDAGCGGCILVPDPFIGFGFAANTDALGAAEVAMSIPNSPALRGLVFYDQWLVTDASSPACAPLGVDLSNAIQVEIQ